MIVPGSGFDGCLERGQVDVPQLGVGEVDLVVVAPAQRGAVAGEVLRAGHDPVGRAQAVTLEAAHLGGCDRRPEVRVLAGALDDPAPAGVTRDVDHRRERPADPGRPCLASGDGLALLDDAGIPGRGHGDRHRQDRAQAVDHIESEQDADSVPVALDRQPLQPVHLRRIGDEQQRPDLPLGQRRLDHGRLTGEDVPGLV
jgi:hypothetical protein